MILFLSSKRRRLEARNLAVILTFILTFIPFTTFTTYLQHKRPALQNKRVEVLRTDLGPEEFSGLSRNGSQDRKTVENDFYNWLRPNEFFLTLFLVWCGIDR